MREHILFSIITPTYNRRKLLTRAVESVLAQSYPYWELIIIDDGSTDDTATYISRIADDRIRYQYQDNCGESTARNKGIKMSQGDYILFLDSDDSIYPEYLTEMSSSRGHDIICCGSELIFEKQTIRFIPSRDKKILLTQVLNGEFNLLPFCFRRSLNLEFNEAIDYGEDFILLLSIVLNNRIGIIQEVLCSIYDHSSRYTRSKFKISNWKQFEAGIIHSIYSCEESIKSILGNDYFDNLIQKKMNEFVLGVSQNNLRNALLINKVIVEKYNTRVNIISIIINRLKGIAKSIIY